MRAIGGIVGFALGFLLLTGVATAVNLLYRDVWLPMLLVTCLGLLTAWHPRLSKCPAAGWWIALFATGEFYVWMKAVGPAARDPEKIWFRLAGLMPPIALALALLVLVVFVKKNSAATAAQWLPWLPALVILVIGWGIAYLSGGKGGADPMIQALMDRFHLDEATARTIVIALRKSLHFLVYGSIALAAFRLANPRSGRNQTIAFALLVALSMATFDELRQSSATNRTGSAWDVGLDMLGATTFVGVSVLRYGRRTQRNSAPTRLPG